MASASDESELRWIDEENERASIDAVHAILASELSDWPAAYPADLSHDLTVCRFLRGHQRKEALAAEKMVAAVRYRMELSKDPAVKSMRGAMGSKCTSLDLSLLPNHKDVLRCLPFRAGAEGESVHGLPIAIMPVRLVEPRAFGDMSDKIELFLRCMLEARALVLHNRSMAEKRMVKFVEVRDFNCVYVSELLKHGRPFIQKLKSVLSSLMSHYPELIHQAIIANAPATFSNIYSLVSSVFNDRMQAKILVLPATVPFSRLAELLQPRALHSWTLTLSGVVDWDQQVTVANGASEFTSRWLDAGETLQWKVALCEGETVRIAVHWVATAGNAVVLHDAEIKTSETCEGKHVAAESGVVWLCVDNVASWWYPRVVRATFTHEAATQPTSTAKGGPPIDLD